MDNDPIRDDTLEALFEASKRTTEIPSSDFMERLALDAESAVPVPVSIEPASAPSILASFKGLFAASGLTGAAALGVWIGFVMPETLNTFADGFASEETISLSAFVPSADLFALSE